MKELGDKAYLDELLKEVVWLRESIEEIHFPEPSNIPRYIAPVEKPDKHESIMAMKTIFTASSRLIYISVSNGRLFADENFDLLRF